MRPAQQRSGVTSTLRAMLGPDDLSPLLDGWPGEHTLAVTDGTQVLATAGDRTAIRRIASITKLFTAYACLIAWEEGTLDLDAAAGPAGSTVRHLLAHASGLPFEGDEPVGAVGSRRIYSNTGIDVLAQHLGARAGMPFADYLRFGVLEPVGLGHVEANVSPAHGLRLSVDDLVVFANELLNPTLVHPDTLAMATTPVFADLPGVLPGFGRHERNLWGLGFEIKGDKSPHWTAAGNSPSTFGHFGGAGSFLWIDPKRRLAAVCTGSVEFGAWAAAAWPVANQALIEKYGP